MAVIITELWHYARLTSWIFFRKINVFSGAEAFLFLHVLRTLLQATGKLIQDQIQHAHTLAVWAGFFDDVSVACVVQTMA